MKLNENIEHIKMKSNEKSRTRKIKLNENVDPM